MDFDSILKKYQEELLIENQNLDYKDIYESISSKIVCLYYSVNTNKKDYKKALFYLKLRSLITKENIALKSLSLEEIILMLAEYARLIIAIENVFVEYFKNYDNKDNDNISKELCNYLESLILLINEAYIIDINYDAHLEQTKSNKCNIPNSYQKAHYEIYDLTSFIKLKVASIEEFDYNKFYQKILKK